MIIESLINAIFAVISNVIDIVPEISLGNFIGSMASVTELIVAGSIILPLEAIFHAIVLFVVLSNAHMVMSIINWVIRKIPTIS